MNSYYSDSELTEIGFQSFGTNVRISRKASIYGAENMNIGDHVRIDDFSILSGKITLGNYIHIGPYSGLFAGSEGIILKDYVNISSKNSIYAVGDDYSGEMMTSPLIPEEYTNIVRKQVVIEKHVIIGSGCVILPGCVLREGSAFGAMTLVNHDSEPFSINAGVPFRKIKDRQKGLLEYEKKFDESGVSK